MPDQAFVVGLTRDLIRLDTTNPPGQELIAIDLIERVLDEAGVSSARYENARGRPNLVARLKGRGEAPPFLLQGHVDVVTTVNQSWRHKPFGGEIVDGYLWGRGALDMKGGVAMMVSAVLQAHGRGGAPGDLVLAILADEEAGGNQGAKWLVDNHPELFTGIKHGIGESGGVAQHIGGQRFYPIMVAEKRGCQVLVTLRGPGGHGSIPARGGAMAKLGALLTTLDSARLPVHITPPVKLLLEGMRDALDEPWKGRMAALLDPARADATLSEIGPMGANLDAALHNTVNATMVSGGLKINVIPSEVQVQLDGRLLPGFGPEDMLRELRAVIGPEPELEVQLVGPAQPEIDLSQLELFAAVLREADPGCVPLPYLVTGGTDARHFARLGIRTYGFLPLNNPADFNGATTIHAADERVPVSALEFGARCVFEAVMRYRG
ncbi:MAG: M20/M25/M40 family metallo-hydrolase [Chloroflexi bacterium]|nr:MAG: M20/M25/M40 family metallo-hydrolase [Chloroflexota bacterium]TMC73213.1 MAG: M20/M25/M40 family metallo-hydrolase [Chloroflexota bacterium]